MLTVLIAYFERNTTVCVVCQQYGIAVSTLYAWKHRLLDHKELALGALLSLKKPALVFLRDLFGSDQVFDYLSGFFSRYGFSFMQNLRLKTSRCHPP